jgi:hypothetical protein
VNRPATGFVLDPPAKKLAPTPAIDPLIPAFAIAQAGLEQ